MLYHIPYGKREKEGGRGKKEEGRRRKKQTNNKIEKADPPLLFYCLYCIEYLLDY